MSLETGTFISDLVTANPGATDTKSQGDDHLRLLKSVLQATFANASKAFYFPTTLSKTADFSVLASHMNCTFLTDTTSGSVTYTLPTLASGDAGWECSFVKTNTGTNPMFIAPPSGSIQSGEVSGLSKTRRCIPGHKTRVFWTGSAWIAERVVKSPVGSLIDCPNSSVPVGYEAAQGQTLSSASTNYPDYYSVNGSSGVVPDRGGRVAAGKEAVATRLTSAVSGVDGATVGAAGGTQNHTISTAEMPAHNHTATDSGHTHAVTGGTIGGQSSANVAGGGTNAPILGATITVASGTASITVANSGGGGAMTITQPTMVTNMIVVVE